MCTVLNMINKYKSTRRHIIEKLKNIEINTKSKKLANRRRKRISYKGKTHEQ